jgi:hypothetical protein
VIDAERKVIVGDMDFASADEPYRVYFAGTDISDEIRTSPVEVGAVGFEDGRGSILIYLCNDREAAREVTVDFRGETFRRSVEAGRLLEIRIGEPVLVDAMPTHDPRQAAAPVG